MRLSLAAAAFVLTVVAAPAAAQSIRGRVVDERGAPVSRAEVDVLPSGRPSFTDASGAFDLGPLSTGTYRVLVRRIGFDLTVARVDIPLTDPKLVIFLRHSALALDTVHTTALEWQLPRLFDRIRNHVGAALYGPALDSMFARGGSRSLSDLMTIDGRFASMLRRPFCGGPYVFVDDVPVPGKLNVDEAMATKPLDAANLELYISQKDIAAIEVFDSADGVHEPPLGSGGSACVRIVFIWSKYYQQKPWAGH